MKTRQILYAEDGMVLTDGNVYGKVIYLAEGADATSFREITDDAYAAVLQEQEETW